jgi:extracellular factor (EF) 3-hydroxypalmitic acid methyl ester biosynthesis protein
VPKPLEFLTPNDHALLAGKAKVTQFRSGDVLIREGAPAKFVYILMSGMVRIVRSEATLAKLISGEVCGEMSFLESTMASASVIADNDVTAQALSVSDLNEIFESFPHLAARFYRSVAVVLSNRLRETSRELAKSKDTMNRSGVFSLQKK